MKRDKLEEFIGKRVTIVLIDGDEITGDLHKTGEDMFKNDANLYIPKNYYTLINPKCHLIFRPSHVKKIQLNNG